MSLETPAHALEQLRAEVGTHPYPTAMTVTCSSRTKCPGEKIRGVKISARLNSAKMYLSLSSYLSSLPEKQCGPPYTQAPEILRGCCRKGHKINIEKCALLHPGRHPGLRPEGAKEHGTVHATYFCPCLSANLVTDLAVGEFSNFGGQMFLLQSSNCHSLGAGISLANITEH